MVTVLPLFLLLTLLGAAFYWSVVLSFMALISPSTCTEINSHKHGRGAQAGDWQNFISSGAPGSCVEWRGQKKKKKKTERPTHPPPAAAGGCGAEAGIPVSRAHRMGCILSLC